MTPFTIEHHGTLDLIRPNTETAREWLRESAPDDAMFFGDALVCEPRYTQNVLAAFEEYGS